MKVIFTKKTPEVPDDVTLFNEVVDILPSLFDVIICSIMLRGYWLTMHIETPGLYEIEVGTK